MFIYQLTKYYEKIICFELEKIWVVFFAEICCLLLTSRMCVYSLSLDGAGTDGVSASDISANQHKLVCCLLEVGGLIQGLGSTATPLLTDTSIGLWHQHTHTTKHICWGIESVCQSCFIKKLCVSFYSHAGHINRRPPLPLFSCCSCCRLVPALYRYSNAFFMLTIAGPLLRAPGSAEVVTWGCGWIWSRHHCPGGLSAALPSRNTSHQGEGTVMQHCDDVSVDIHKILVRAHCALSGLIKNHLK